MTAARHRLSGDRWHFQHGPIDIIIGAEGDAAVVEAAHAAAWQRFETVLAEIVNELGRLRQPIEADDIECPLKGVVARRMWNACHPYRSQFITPMAAVAGSVAQELIESYDRDGVQRAWVNNGGDIALHLATGASVKIGLYADLSKFDVRAVGRAADPGTHGSLSLDGSFEVQSSMPVRGVATSGWRGRSFSLGIADSVTVLAQTAAQADAAATIVANAVNVNHPAIVRRQAWEIDENTDLGSLCVTTDVPRLAPMLVARALNAGKQVAEQLQAEGRLWGAVLVCQEQVITVGSVLA